MRTELLKFRLLAADGPLSIIASIILYLSVLVYSSWFPGLLARNLLFLASLFSFS